MAQHVTPGHGITMCARVYQLPEGVRYLVVSSAHDFRNRDLLQALQGHAVQVTIDEDLGESVFLWPTDTVDLNVEELGHTKMRLDQLEKVCQALRSAGSGISNDGKRVYIWDADAYDRLIGSLIAEPKSDQET